MKAYTQFFMNIRQTKIKFAVIVLLLLNMVGCASLKQTTAIQQLETPRSDCKVTKGAPMDIATTELNDKLASGACHDFDQAFKNLYVAGQEDPGELNKELFASFINEALKYNVVTKKQAQNVFNRNFHSTFMTLDDSFQACAALKNKSVLLKELMRELGLKERGYLSVLSDKKGYEEVYRQYQDIVLVIDATDLACKGRVSAR